MADDLLNLVEYAKGHENPFTSALVEQFALASDVLQRIEFKTAPQGRNPFSREVSLPNMAFRGINQEPDISHGMEEEFQDHCYPIAGLLEFDRVKLNRYGERKRKTYLRMQMKKGAQIWVDTFISGDNATNPKEFTGLQGRLLSVGGVVDGSTDDSRLIANSTSSGGAALSLAKLDLAVDLVNGTNAILASRRMLTKFKAAARDPALTNNQITDDFESDLGRRVTRFGGIPILTGYEPSKNTLFLPFNEVANGGGGAVTTSIYPVSFREDGVAGIHTQPPEMVDLGHTDKGIHERDLFEWDVGITIEDYYSAMRLSSITDAAIVA